MCECQSCNSRDVAANMGFVLCCSRLCFSTCFARSHDFLVFVLLKRDKTVKIEGVAIFRISEIPKIPKILRKMQFFKKDAMVYKDAREKCKQ
jgi:hypothetical protein